MASTTVVNKEPATNKLLCFVSAKVGIMTFDSLKKLCTDFYDVPEIRKAKDILLSKVTLPDGDKRKTRRRSNLKDTIMKDIISIFLEISKADMPLFLAANLNNIPPLSMNNFDMSSLIIDIETIKSQMKMLQESQEASMSVHAAICQEAFNKRDHPPPVNNTPNSPIGSVAATPQQRRNRHQPSPAPQSPPDVSTPTHTDTTDENDEDPEDVLRLARIQGRLPPARTPSGESIMSETSYASVVRREQLNQQRRSVADPANRVNRGNRYNPNYNEQRTVNPDKSRTRPEVIGGSGLNFELKPSDYLSKRDSYKKKEQCIGLFVSRVKQFTRARDVARHVYTVTELSLKCVPLPAKFDSYTSFCVHASTKDTNTLLNPKYWPQGVIVRKYDKTI